MKALSSLLGLVLATTLVAQSPVVTLYPSGNGGAVGGQVFFDLQVTSQITLQALDVNLGSAAGTPGTIEIRTRNGTYLGNELNAAQWPAVATASGAVVSNGQQVPSPVCLTTPLVLNPGLTGFCIRYVGVQALYQNGNGTVVPGGGGPATNQTFVTTECTLLAGSAQNTQWAATFQPRVFSGSLHYIPGASGTPCSALPAANLVYGTACIPRVGSWYDNFNPAVAPATAAAVAATNLSGRTFTYIPNGLGYDLVQNIATFQPTTSAVALTGFTPDADDGELVVPLSTPFPYAGGTLNNLTVSTNGMVSTGSNRPFFNLVAPNPVTGALTGYADFWPTVRRMLDAPNAAWYAWHDFNPTEAGSGSIKFEEVGGVAYITWDGVESYPGVPTVNRGTVQFQFDSNSGQVSVVFGALSSAGFGNDVSDIWLVGYSPAGVGGDNGETDVTTAPALLALDGLADRLPLTLKASSRAVLGATIKFTTSSLTPSTVPLGAVFIGTTDGGQVELIGLAPGCFVNTDVANPVVTLTYTDANPTVSQFLPVIPAFNGLQVYAQSVFLDPAVNSLQATLSNGIRLTAGSW